MDTYFLPKNGLARCYLSNTLSYSDSFFQNQLWKKFHSFTSDCLIMLQLQRDKVQTELQKL